jgi:hypothetical protein
MDAITALRQALYQRLTVDTPLTSLIAGRVYDEPPRAPVFPFVTLGETRLSDASTGSGPMSEQALTLHIWSQQGGLAEAQAVTAALTACLDDVSLTLAGHALVNLRFTLADLRRESDGRSYHAIVRFRALTAPL